MFPFGNTTCSPHPKYFIPATEVIIIVVFSAALAISKPVQQYFLQKVTRGPETLNPDMLRSQCSTSVYKVKEVNVLVYFVACQFLQIFDSLHSSFLCGLYEPHLSEGI